MAERLGCREGRGVPPAATAVIVAVALILSADAPAEAQEKTAGYSPGSVLPIRGTDAYYDSDTQKLYEQIAEDEAQSKGYEDQVKALEQAGASKNHDEVQTLKAKQKELDDERNRLEADLSGAKLVAVRDAEEGDAPSEQLAAKEEKRDALRALRDWTKQYVGGFGDETKTVEDEIEKTEKAISQLQEQTQAANGQEGRGGASPSGSSGGSKTPTRSSNTSGDGGGMGLGGFLLLCFLFAGVVLFLAGRTGGEAIAKVRRSLGTRLASVNAPGGSAYGADGGNASPAGSSPPPPRQETEQETREYPPGDGTPKDRPPPAGGSGKKKGPLYEEDGPPKPSEEETQPGPTAPRTCHECGAEVSTTAKFCRACGAPL